MIESSSTEELYREFPVVHICRADLLSLGMSVDAVRQITDEQMERLAVIMSDLYLYNGYWEDLKAARDGLFGQQEEEQGKQGV